MPLDLTVWRRDLQTRPEDAVRALIEGYVRVSPLNRLQHLDNSPIFDEPLVAYADGDDPLFAQYKTIIGSFHLTPREAMHLAQEEAGMPNIALTRAPISVIAWVLPITEATRRSNRVQDREPSERWAHTRTYGEQFNDALRRHVVEALQQAGYLAIAPVLSPVFGSRQEAARNPPASNWSERHILYVAGLGTFSLNDALITPRGMAMRCGSVVTDLPLAAGPRPYADHVANCLYLAQGTCGDCIARCPAGAITTAGHDKAKCEAYAYGTLLPLKERYGVTTVGCGLCQTRVPCEARIPRVSGE